ncbi:MAG: cation:proton antiporter [Gammaproteobacteria bacterium]|nr:cation:proton antiporter [Gammaproteobacteria bacterium]
MYELAPLIKDLAVVLGIASLVTLLFQKIHQPVVLGYLIAGLIIGPYTPPAILITDQASIQTLSQLGVIFLMFSLGLEFSFHKLKRVGVSAVITGLIEVILVFSIGLLMGIFIGWSFENSLFLGAGLAISSTTIIIKALEELNLKHKRFAELVFGILIVEDLLAILILVGLSMVVTTRYFFSVTLLIAAFKLILVVGGWFLIGYFLVPTLLNRVARYLNEETLTIVSVALCLFLVCLASYFNYSTALGAFIMGSILAETTLVSNIKKVVLPIRNIFAAVFFVSIGMLINPKIIMEHWILVLLLTFVTIVGKIITTGLGALLTGQSLNTSIRISFSMAQIGEFSFIIMALGVSLNIINTALYPIIVAVSVITTFTTPYFIQLSSYIAEKTDKNIPKSINLSLNNYSAWIYRAQTGVNQKNPYGKIIIRLTINSLIVAIIFTLANHLLLPEVKLLMISPLISKATTSICALLLSSPFIWGILTATQNISFTTTHKNTSRCLFFGCCLIVAVELFLLSIIYFKHLLVSFFVLIIATIFFLFLYKFLEKYYQFFERHLIKNLSGKSIHHRRYKELALWDGHLMEVCISARSRFVGRTLEKLQIREKYGINIVIISRSTQILYTPTGAELICALDKLIVLGNDTQIEKFRIKAEKDIQEDLSPHDLLANFSLKAVLIKDAHPALNKSIRELNLRKHAQALVVGLERKGKRVLNPPSTTILQVGDLLLIVGNEEMLNKL